MCVSRVLQVDYQRSLCVHYSIITLKTVILVYATDVVLFIIIFNTYSETFVQGRNVNTLLWTTRNQHTRGDLALETELRSLTLNTVTNR